MHAKSVVLHERVRAVLDRVGRSRSGEQRHVERAVMVVLASDGLSDAEIARRLGMDVQRPRRWRKRWLQAVPEIAAVVSSASDRDFERLVLDGLTDAPRSGGPPTFGPEAVAKLIALACETPASNGLPIDHWTPSALAQEAVKRGIVESISPRHLDRILKRGRSAAA